MISRFAEHEPNVAPGAWVAGSALVMGQVTLERDSSIWYGCVVRGDVNKIHIGHATNIQDRSVIHVTSETHPTIVGARVTVGHGVILHGCTISDDALVGMGAIVLDGATIGPGCIVAAGTLVPPRKVFPPGCLIMGNPGRVIRQVSSQEADHIRKSSEEYVALANQHRAL